MRRLCRSRPQLPSVAPRILGNRLAAENATRSAALFEDPLPQFGLSCVPRGVENLVRAGTRGLRGPTFDAAQGEPLVDAG
jgi:hypothetical protein